MNKSNKIYIFIIVLVAIMLECGVAIFNTNTIYDKTNVKCSIDVSSNQTNEYQIFTARAQAGKEAVYTEARSCVKKLENTDENVTLTFSYQADSNVMRIDFGNTESIINLRKVTLAYKGKEITISADKLFELLIQSNDLAVQGIDNQGQLVIKGYKGDPYAVFDVREFTMSQVVRAKDRNLYRVIKLAAAVLILSVALLLIKKRNKVMACIKRIYDDRKLIWSLSKNDFKTKYAGSYLGIVWAFVQPIVTVCVYWFVFSVGLRTNKVGDIPYHLWLVAGLVPWFFFSDALMGGTNALLEYNYLVKKIVFRINILPVVKVISALFVHLFFIVFMLFMYICSGYFPDWYALQIIYYSICTFALVLCLSYATCAIVVFFRDLTQIINIFLQIGIWMTPIMWNVTILPKSLTWIFNLNPFYYIVQGYRDSLIDKIGITERLGQGLYFWCIIIVLYIIGTKLFKRLKDHFADVL